MKEQCAICGERTEETSVCQVCMDIEEFGYPSFPAYALAETEVPQVEQRKEKRLQLVG
ncbi:hypothetical protein [Aneurinibacillus aneurinilyticus]|jgi:hypothetical protein|uniref:Uncharacterized protein n=1 Tax=Aneurinibacillus aneurinilyticus TaxID=1391 RepID=A0A848D123_ANEAE|nr:hypothetical protein [Aneurinibacillus aneurinilyticus]MCI1692743.1 hypothetical protein [Aneurinibacillus aneurinilyticus]NME99632.1 hypothetical protein [Aneurinibacillus aneurinilyticus]